MERLLEVGPEEWQTCSRQSLATRPGCRHRRRDSWGRVTGKPSRVQDGEALGGRPAQDPVLEGEKF